MPIKTSIPLEVLYGFALVLTRILGLFTFLPLPAMQAGPDAARIVLAVVTTISLFARWPHLDKLPRGPGELLLWLMGEVLLGLAIGLCVSFLLEIFTMAAQAVSIQAGFGFASTVDPSTNADSTVLIMAAQLTGGLLFFAAGLDGQVLKILAASLDTRPPGQLLFTHGAAQALLMTGAGVFSTGLRLALPLITLLLLVDLSIGLLSRVNAQLHVMSFAHPLKLLIAMAAMGWSVLLYPRILGQSANAIFGILKRFLEA